MRPVFEKMRAAQNDRAHERNEISGRHERAERVKDLMAKRKSIDCRNYPSENNCSLEISGTENEVLDAAMQHAVSAHGHKTSPELRNEIKSMLKDKSD